MSRYRALTFDCYGTLIDWERGLVDFLLPWLRSHGGESTEEELLGCFAEAEARREAESPGRPYREILSLVFADIARRYSVALAEGEAGKLPDSLRDWPPFPDTVGALRELKRDHVLVVVSNVDRELFSWTEKTLAVPFDAVVTAGEVGAYKPDLAMFHRALAVLEERDIGKADLLHVAQSLYHDHVPAKSLGLATAWVNRRQGKAGSGATRLPEVSIEPDLTVASLTELVAVLRNS